MRYSHYHCVSSGTSMTYSTRYVYEWGLAEKTLTTGSCQVVIVPKDPTRSPCWLQTTAVSAWSGEVAEPDNGPLAAYHLWWWVQIPTLPVRWQAYGTPFIQTALPAKVSVRLIGSKLVMVQHTAVHVWGAFHSGAKSPLNCAVRQIPHRRVLQGHFAKHLSAICQAAFFG